MAYTGFNELYVISRENHLRLRKNQPKRLELDSKLRAHSFALFAPPKGIIPKGLP